MVAGDLTVIRYSGTGSHKGDEQSCGRDEKVTRNPATEKLQPRLKVTVGNWDRDNGQIPPIGPLTPLGHLNPLKCSFRWHFQHNSIPPKEEGRSLTFDPAVSAHCLFHPGQRNSCLPIQFTKKVSRFLDLCSVVFDKAMLSLMNNENSLILAGLLSYSCKSAQMSDSF